MNRLMLSRYPQPWPWSAACASSGCAGIPATGRGELDHARSAMHLSDKPRATTLDEQWRKKETAPGAYGLVSGTAVFGTRLLPVADRPQLCFEKSIKQTTHLG